MHVLALSTGQCSKHQSSPLQNSDAQQAEQKQQFKVINIKFMAIYVMLWPQHLLFLLNIARTVPRGLAREFLWMRLYWVRVEDLHHLAEVHTLHKLVDFLVVVVMTEHQQNCVNVPRLCQAHDEVPQVDDACVYLLQEESESVSRHCRVGWVPPQTILWQRREAPRNLENYAET